MSPPANLQGQVNACMARFYERRKGSLDSLSLSKILRKKNPYVSRAAGFTDPRALVEDLLDAHIRESDEAIFGETVFEAVALWACKGIGGKKSGADRVDIEIHTANKVKAIAVKSSPNWGNSSQWEKLRQDLQTLKVKLHALDKNFEGVAGHASGQQLGWYKQTIRKVSGQAFWEEVSGDPEFYLRLMSAIDAVPTELALGFEVARAKALEEYVREFRQGFCTASGGIDWAKWARINSGPKKGKASAEPKGKGAMLESFEPD